MIKTWVGQNENGVYCLQIHNNDKLIFESYNEKTDEFLREMADLAEYIAEDMYLEGYDDGEKQVEYFS